MFVLEDDTIWEDAATGSANGCFVAYLLKHNNPSQSVIVEQGYEMGRESILYLDRVLKENKYILKVGAQVISVSEQYSQFKKNATNVLQIIIST